MPDAPARRERRSASGGATHDGLRGRGTPTTRPGRRRSDDAARPGLRQAAAALGHRDFALFWVAALVSNTGTWIQGVTVPFVLYHLTGSAAWVGFATFAQFLPAVLVGPLAGSLADRFPRRRLLLVTQSLMAAVAATLWVVWSAGVESPVVITAIVTVAGVIGGLNIPSWQAFVTDLVPREALLNAVTLNSAQFNGSRAFGPALGGLVLATLGPGWAFLLNAGSYGAVIAALLAIRAGSTVVPSDGARPRVLREFVTTVRYVRARPGIRVCVLVVVCLGLLGSPLFSLLVVFAEDVFHVSGALYGLLGASLGIGAVLGTPFVAGRTNDVARGPLTARALLVYGLAVVAFGLAPVYAAGVAVLVVAGACFLALAATMNTTIQLQVDEAMRGKVISVYLMGLTGSVPLGALAQGWLAEHAGPRPTVVGAGALLLAAAVWLRAGDRFAAMDVATSPPARRLLPGAPFPEGTLVGEGTSGTVAPGG